MQLHFYGAAREVTGSCYLLRACGKNIMIDCGMEQGADMYVNQALPVPANQVDCVIVTHAHIDHTGNLPLLCKQGFCGDIVATGATAKLCGIMLRDSAHIQESEAQWKNKKAKRSGRGQVEPMYNMEDAEAALRLFRTADYAAPLELFEGVRATFFDAGHILGSASVRLEITEEGQTRTVVFSGDIGNAHKPLVNDPTYLDSADYVVMESTYGDRRHGAAPDYVTQLSAVIQRTLDRGGNLVIPAFAVGRTQELLYYIREIKAKGLVKGHDGFLVYVDSPMANEATAVYSQSVRGYFDRETLALVDAGINPLRFEGLRTSVTAEDSIAINQDPTPKVIISASGMCEAGRIRHHLKHNLWRKECTVLFVGYQSEGTVGRALLEGAKQVKLFGEDIAVNAEIARMEGTSSHADVDGLLAWVSAFAGCKPKVFVCHGEDAVCEGFAATVRERLGFDAAAPYSGDGYDLLSGKQVDFGPREKVKPKAQTAQYPENSYYGRLKEALARLGRVCERFRFGANRDVRQLTEEIESLIRRFEK